MPTLEPGDPMPDVMLIGPGGPVRLRDHIGKPLVVYFYPKDDTPGCTIQACGFRDQYGEFLAAGADVIGVSSDNATSHAQFIAKYQLPFELLSDPDGKIAGAWGVRGLFGAGGRVTFIFDKEGILRHRFDSRLRFGKHVDEALTIVQKLARIGQTPAN
ncbi:MAG: peroxiredoxin [Kofleriaceae bacterium]